MIKTHILTLLAFLLLATATGYAAEAAVDSAVITAGQKAHPRLIFTDDLEAELHSRLKHDKDMQSFFEVLQTRADELIPQAPMERIKTGKRLLFVSRTVLERVLQLSTVFRITGDEKYLKRAEQEMLSAADFSDWNPDHWLDVAEMSTALAFGYDWLYNDLSKASQTKIRNALLHKGIAVYKGKKSSHNWNDVCNGSMIMTSLALAETHPELAVETIKKALSLLPVALKTYTPNGGHMEGPGWYWNYANLYSVPTIACMESACGTDFGLTEKFKGFMAGADFFLHMHGPTGYYFNYSDSGSGEPYLSPPVFWFSKRLNDPSLLWFQAQALRRGENLSRFGAFAFLWWPKTLEVPPPPKLYFQSDGTTPVATHRSSWTDPNASFIGFKGGMGAGPHGHMDIGSFIYESDGVRWALDLGAQSYNSLESIGFKLFNKNQDADRWKVFRLGPYSHNTLVVNNELQLVKGKGTFTAKGPDFSVMELSSLYSPHLSKASRGVRLLEERRAMIQDELIGSGNDTEVRWAMLTEADVDIKGSQAHLTQSARDLYLTVIEPSDAKFEIYPSDPPPNDYDYPNPGTKMIGFKTKPKPNTPTRLLVILSPEPLQDNKEVSVSPLSEWDSKERF